MQTNLLQKISNIVLFYNNRRQHKEATLRTWQITMTTDWEASVAMWVDDVARAECGIDMWLDHNFFLYNWTSNHVCSLATLRLIWSKRACCLVELFVAVSFLAVPVDIVTGRNPSLKHTCNASLRVGASLCSTWLDSSNETARCLRCQPADQTMFSLCNWLFFFCTHSWL